MKANRQWSDKWSRLIDPKTFNDQETRVTYAQKLAVRLFSHPQNTAWSEWSVLNPPNPSIILHKTKPKPQKHFKITGNRDHYMSYSTPKEQHIVSGLIASSTNKRKIDTPRFYPCTSNNEYGWQWQGLGETELFKNRR
jgi:hypothetical protein